jgi:hypothetical protein
MIFIFDSFLYTVQNYKILIQTNKIIKINHNKSIFYRKTCNLIDIFNEFILQQKSVIFPPILNLKQLAPPLNLKWGNMQLILVKKINSLKVSIEL